MQLFEALLTCHRWQSPGHRWCHHDLTPAAAQCPAHVSTFHAKTAKFSPTEDWRWFDWYCGLATPLQLQNPHEDEIDISLVQDCGDLILASVGVQIIKVNHSCNKILLFSAFLASWSLWPTAHNVSTIRWREKRTRRMVVMIDIFYKSMIHCASWTMELWYSEGGWSPAVLLWGYGIETTDSGSVDQDQDPGNTGPGTTRNTQLNCLLSLWTRITRDGRHQDIRRNISYFVRDSSFLNPLTTTVIEQVKWFPSLTILMESAGWELRLSYLQLQGHFAIYLHLHFTVPRVMFWLFCPSK